MAEHETGIEWTHVPGYKGATRTTSPTIRVSAATGLPRVDILRTIPAAVRFLSVEPLLEDLGPFDLTGIHWVLIGGESGPSARDCDTRAVRRVVAQCREQGVPAFVKQLGAKPFSHQAGDYLQIRSRKGEDMSEWPEDLRVREWPRCVRDGGAHAA